ncbi:hypothetical protein [Aureivirga marina]|uniref:hypothetical protein n=1 Tax=Aureivirga marina TaxID=1182451 RepID=UPI0018CB8B41|nr:hypothetical protein [Aureivirga marina]
MKAFWITIVSLIFLTCTKEILDTEAELNLQKKDEFTASGGIFFPEMGVMFDRGRHPNSAINNKNRIVTIHNSSPANNMYYRAGTVNGNQIDFHHTQQKYLDGINGSIDLNDNNLVVEAHEYIERLYNQVGILNDDNSINWLWSGKYESYAQNPSISVNNDGWVVEAHESRNPFSSQNVFYRLGKIENNQINYFFSKRIEDYISKPRISIYNDNVVLVYTQSNYEITVQTGTLDRNVRDINWKSKITIENALNGDIQAIGDDKFMLIFKEFGVPNGYAIRYAQISGNTFWWISSGRVAQRILYGSDTPSITGNIQFPVAIAYAENNGGDLVYYVGSYSSD